MGSQRTDGHGHVAGHAVEAIGFLAHADDKSVFYHLFVFCRHFDLNDLGYDDFFASNLDILGNNDRLHFTRGTGCENNSHHEDETGQRPSLVNHTVLSSLEKSFIVYPRVNSAHSALMNYLVSLHLLYPFPIKLVKGSR